MTVRQEILEIIGRARRIGWEVETGSRGSEWLYRITAPDNARVQIHGTPSDVNWKKSVMRQLNQHGFKQAEDEWVKNDLAERARKLEADRDAAERKAATVAKKAATINRALTKAAGSRAIHEADLGWLMTPAEVPESRFMIITPEAATKILATINTHNRPKRPGHVDYLARIIEEGDWGQTHQGGAIDWNGVLQDGQHRLWAVERAGKPVVMQWTIGLDPANYPKIDVGSQRTGRDFAVMNGVPYASLAPSAARMILQIEMYGPEAHVRKGKVKISLDRVQRAVEEYGEDLIKALARALKIRVELKVNATGIGTAVYLISRRLPEGDPRVEQFLDDLETGANVGLNDPVRHLRRFIFRSRDVTRGSTRTFSSYDVTALILKAWNIRMAGRTVQHLTFRSNEPFPATVFLPPPLEATPEPGPEPGTAA